jgi:hypothetical protein
LLGNVFHCCYHPFNFNAQISSESGLIVIAHISLIFYQLVRVRSFLFYPCTNLGSDQCGTRCLLTGDGLCAISVETMPKIYDSRTCSSPIWPVESRIPILDSWTRSRSNLHGFSTLLSRLHRQCLLLAVLAAFTPHPSPKLRYPVCPVLSTDDVSRVAVNSRLSDHCDLARSLVPQPSLGRKK